MGSVILEHQQDISTKYKHCQQRKAQINLKNENREHKKPTKLTGYYNIHYNYIQTNDNFSPLTMFTRAYV